MRESLNKTTPEVVLVSEDGAKEIFQHIHGPHTFV